MFSYSLEIPPHVAEVIRRLPPEIKRVVKESLRALSLDSTAGEPLKKELKGLYKIKARRYRIIYALNSKKRKIQIYAVGHRRDIYDIVAGVGINTLG